LSKPQSIENKEKKSRASLRFLGQEMAHETQESQQTEVIDPCAAKVLRSISLLLKFLPRCGYKQEHKKGRRSFRALPLFIIVNRAGCLATSVGCSSDLIAQASNESCRASREFA